MRAKFLNFFRDQLNDYAANCDSGPVLFWKLCIQYNVISQYIFLIVLSSLSFGGFLAVFSDLLSEYAGNCQHVKRLLRVTPPIPSTPAHTFVQVCSILGKVSVPPRSQKAPSSLTLQGGLPKDRNVFVLKRKKLICLTR